LDVATKLQLLQTVYTVTNTKLARPLVNPMFLTSCFGDVRIYVSRYSCRSEYYRACSALICYCSQTSVSS